MLKNLIYYPEVRVVTLCVCVDKKLVLSIALRYEILGFFLAPLSVDCFRLSPQRLEVGSQYYDLLQADCPVLSLNSERLFAFILSGRL